MTFDNKYFEHYIKGDVKHFYYDNTVDISSHLKFHFEGVKNIIYPYEKENKYFKILIEERRPNEGTNIWEHRKKQYTPITKQVTSKVTATLKKIPRSLGWKINFSDTEKNSLVPNEISLENYLTDDYPVFGSVENWYFNSGLENQLKDPNGLILVIPYEYYLSKEELDAYPENENKKPIAIFVPSEAVLDYVYESHAFIFSNEKFNYLDSENKQREGHVYWLIEKGLMTKVFVKQDKNFTVVPFAPLPTDDLACWRIGGKYRGQHGITPVYDSFVSAMLPSLDQAARESSDLDAAVVLHLYPTMWYFAGQDCNACAATGFVLKAGKQVICGKCEGNGRLLHSPYKDLVVKPQEVGQQPIPTPPMGFVEKDTAIIKLQDERIKAHKYDALSAINLNFLDQAPLNISGEAKAIDRDEINNFLSDIARSAAYNIEEINEMIVKERYPYISPDAQYKMLPDISIPLSFDIETLSGMAAEIKMLMDADADLGVINALEIEYINKKFAGRPDLRKKFVAGKLLDPFAGLSNEEKENLMLSGTAKKEDVILSVYIIPFIEKALRENKTFMDLEADKQLEILYKYAAEKVTAPEGKVIVRDNNGMPVE
jgi:hypothetical protein